MPLNGPSFEIQAVESAGSAASVQRQAHFSWICGEARDEHDIWAMWSG